MKACWAIGIVMAAALQAQTHDCSVKVYMITASIVIQLEPTTRYPVPQDALAYAMPIRTGTCIHVFLDRVSLNRTQTFANALLAHVMVHEIGHVLEQMQRHSAEGVMKARWSAADYQHMERDPLPFASEDVESIREVKGF